MFQIGPYCLNLVSIKLSFVSVRLKEKNEMNSYHESISSFFHDGDEILQSVDNGETLLSFIGLNFCRSR